jgi:Transposase DDE domain
VDPQKQYPFLKTLLSSFHWKQRQTLGLVIAAIAVTGQARSFAIATTLSRWLKTRLDSSVNRFYRLLRNPRIDYLGYVEKLAGLFVRGADRHLVISIDWTEWHHDLRMLSAAVVVGKRAIPLFTQAFAKVIRRGSQNQRENTFLRVLTDCLRRAEVTATILCDRGFRRVSWLMLLQDLRLNFVVRLMDDVFVETPSGVQMPLKNILLTPGQILDLGVVQLRADGACTVRIIGYWAIGAPEPWWLATGHTGPARKVIQFYDRRMTVEEQFRDTKGKRFGVKLVWTQFRDPEALARFCMLLAVALLIWTITGFAAAKKNPSLRLVSRKKGPRQSYVTIGLRLLCIEQPGIIFSERVISRLLEPPTLRPIGKMTVGGK